MALSSIIPSNRVILSLVISLCVLNGETKCSEKLNKTFEAQESTTRKNLTTTNSIELLLEEISHLKHELVPESAQYTSKFIGGQKLAPSHMALPFGNLNQQPPSRKQIKVRELIETTELDKNQMETQKNVGHLNSNTSGSLTSTFNSSTFKPTPVKDANICDKSIAVGTLGYHLLCRHFVRSNKSLTQTMREPSAKVNNSTRLVEQSNCRHQEEMILESEEELAHLKSLLDQLIKNGNFRSRSTANASGQNLSG